MTNPDFIYTTYIKSTPEKVWSAITNPEFARQYWGMENISDWKKGSEWKMVAKDGEVKTIGKVLESDPPTHLVTSWASPNNKADESQVTYTISMAGELVRLDVVHTKLSAEMGSAVSGGWPRVLSGLKSFLETGAVLDIWSGQSSCGSKTAAA